ncbi:MAG TPA: GDP-mannose 4,6-dehydratase, partial [Blastocatellia bacterium]|nr:GDP-mannose 4,6-dehydratase [Blastocatellia bacterium]
MIILITGASGQDGHYLTKLCQEQGAKVIGVGRTGPDLRFDVTDFSAVEDLIRAIRPTFVFHLAADSTLSHEALFSNHAAISTGAVNVLEACWRHCRGARVFFPGSAMQFANTGKPIDEDTPFESKSPYAAARIYLTYLARYFRSLGLYCYVGYLFHHDSPLRSHRHLSQKVARAVAQIAAGSGEQLTVGNLSIDKEWTFAGDTVRAIWMLVNQDMIYEAVIGSGCAYP